MILWNAMCNRLTGRHEQVRSDTQARLARHYGDIGIAEANERSMTRREAVCELQLELLDEADRWNPGGPIDPRQDYLAGLETLARHSRERFHAFLTQRMANPHHAYIYSAERGEGVRLDDTECLRQTRAFELELQRDLALWRTFTFAPYDRNKRAAQREAVTREFNQVQQQAAQMRRLLREAEATRDRDTAPLRLEQQLVEAGRMRALEDTTMHRRWLALCIEGELEVVAPILKTLPDRERPACINEPGEDGLNALHIACMHGHYALVAMLLQAGADPAVRTGTGRLPAHMAVSKEAGREAPAVLNCLASHRVDLRERDCEGRSILNEAVFQGNLDAVQWLCSHGFAPTESDHAHRRSLLHIACAEGHADVTAFLLDHGCDPNARNIGNERPLFEAVYHGRAAVAQVFLDRGMWLNQSEIQSLRDSGRAALADVACAMRLPVVRTLQENDR